MQTIKIEIVSEIGIERDELVSLAREVMRRRGIGDYHISIIEIDDETTADLNRRFRGTMGTTDVLSFKIEDDPLEGEIYLNVDRARHFALNEGNPLSEEIRRLVVHGALHLSDIHHSSESERKNMERLTAEILTADSSGK